MSDGRSFPPDRVDLEGRHLAGVLVGAVIVSAYATWMLADLLDRWLVLALAAIGTGVLLYRRPDPVEKAVVVGYALAALLALTPVAFVLPEFFAEQSGLGTRAFGAANLVIAAAFLGPAPVVAYATYRIGGGRGLLGRLRAAI